MERNERERERETYEEATVEGFTALTFDGVMSCSSFCGVCTATWFTFGL